MIPREAPFAPRILESEDDYLVALAYVASLMDVQPGTAEAEALALWGLLVSDYEDRHYPMTPTAPVPPRGWGDAMTIPDDVRERLAAVQHEIWAHWMRYLFDVCETDDTRDGRVVIIPADKVKRWQRQMNTPYVDLTDREQESDRHQADKILAALDVSAAPDVMTIPDDVREAMRQALEFCAGDYCMTGDRYDHFDAALAWLEAH